jgi:hypothetical protein
MPADYVLTTFTPAMFGEGATAHIRIVPREEALKLVDQHTRVAATRVSHERLAKAQFPGVAEETARFAMLKPGVTAIHILYRGPQVPDDGTLPVGGTVMFYLIEVEEYQTADE